MDIKLVLLILSPIIIFLFFRFIRPYVCAPKLTDSARHQFILDTLRNRAFSEIIKKGEINYNFRGENLYAHWLPVKDDKTERWIIEFDVHPHLSKKIFSISRSEFITIRDEQHLSEIKKRLSNSDDYSFLKYVDSSPAPK